MSTTANIVTIRLNGIVSLEDVKAYEADINNALENNTTINILMDISNWSDMTPEAVAEDVNFELGLLEHVEKFTKIAIISDKLFVKPLIRYMAPFMPNVEIAVFNSSEQDKAESFVA